MGEIIVEYNNRLSDYIDSLPNIGKLAIAITLLSIILWGVITEKTWATRWTNTAKMQMFINLLGWKWFRILNAIMIIIAMISITYLYIKKGL